MQNCSNFYRTMCFCLTPQRNTDHPIMEPGRASALLEKSESNFEQKFGPNPSNSSAYEKRFMTTESNRSGLSVIRRNNPYSSTDQEDHIFGESVDIRIDGTIFKKRQGNNIINYFKVNVVLYEDQINA